ncbi:MAG TPA: aldo/keto reductase, partial [Candidatus Nanopelagicales bacterium]|nr:aldo/keto reductase [Candidatus Nanopelagicales bacterium]
MPMIPGTDLTVPPFVLGGNVFGWTADARQSYAVLDAFVAAGGAMIDTADSYAHWLGDGGGESETILGRWLADRGLRDQVLIATKVGKSPDNRGLSPAGIRAGLEGSLRRLGTDRVDLYYAHEDDLAVPMVESLAAFDVAVREGTVRYLGASNFTARRLREAVAISQREGLARYVALQPPYNLVDRAGFERELAPVCAELGLGVL